MTAAAALSDTGNDRIAMGANLGPFDAHKLNIESIREEAGAWLTGDKITSAEEAEFVNTLLDMARKAAKAADDERTTEKEPHLTAGKNVDAKWKPLITSATTIADVCKQVLTPWNIAEAQRKADEAARIRAEAEAERQAEVEATRAAAGNIDAREAADQLAQSAKAAERLAKASEKAATTNTGLRAYRSLKVTDTRALAGWLWKHRREEAEAAHAELAQRIFRNNGPAIDGTEIETEMRAI